MDSCVRISSVPLRNKEHTKAEQRQGYPSGYPKIQREREGKDLEEFYLV